MTFRNIESLGQSTEILGLIAKRQQLIGANIANVDTPGYTRKTLDFSQYLGNAAGAMETKLSKEMGASAVVSENTGEKVNVADELIDLQNNSLLYTVATRRVSSVISEMKTVLNVGK